MPRSSSDISLARESRSAMLRLSSAKARRTTPATTPQPSSSTAADASDATPTARHSSTAMAASLSAFETKKTPHVTIIPIRIASTDMRICRLPAPKRARAASESVSPFLYSRQTRAPRMRIPTRSPQNHIELPATVSTAPASSSRPPHRSPTAAGAPATCTY